MPTKMALAVKLRRGPEIFKHTGLPETPVCIRLEIAEPIPGESRINLAALKLRDEE
jgi:hypothetical protein